MDSPANPYATPATADPAAIPVAPPDFGWAIENRRLVVETGARLPMVDPYTGRASETMQLREVLLPNRLPWLRFLPLVPFPVANIAPALLGAKYPDYALTTAIGIIPGVIAYTWIGAGLGATFAAGENPDIASVAGNLVPAFAALAVVSLMPVVWKKTFGRKAPQIESPSA